MSEDVIIKKQRTDADAGNGKALNINADRLLAWINGAGRVIVPMLVAEGVAEWADSRKTPEEDVGPEAEYRQLDMSLFKQDVYSGGSHTAPEARALMCVAAMALKAERILETGYDAGATTEALVLSGAKVVGVDDLSEYPSVAARARERLARYSGQVELVQVDALEYLKAAPDESFDVVFVDDRHDSSHVEAEAGEVRRVLKPGGLAFFHDTKVHGLWAVLERAFPDWEKVNLPAYSPLKKRDFGLGLVRKPEPLPGVGAGG